MVKGDSGMKIWNAFVFGLAPALSTGSFGAYTALLFFGNASSKCRFAAFRYAFGTPIAGEKGTPSLGSIGVQNT